MSEKDFVINDVQVRIKRLNAKEQHDIVNRFFFPITSSAAELLKTIGVNQENKIAIAASLFEAVNKYLPPEKRDELIFKHLLKNVQVIVSGVGMDYCQPDGTIICEPLNNLKALYQIAFESLRLNFEDFFTGLLNAKPLS